MKAVTEHLPWVGVMLKTPRAGRMKWVKIILDGIRSYREKAQARDRQADEQREWLSDLLQDESKFELVGFSPNVQYVKASGSEDQMSALWVHPWGTPQLLYKHKRLPLLIIAGPGIRFNESVLAESRENESESTLGITG